MIVYFWMILTGAAVVWYIFVTAYVSYKGVHDIREMLKTLERKKVQEVGEVEEV